MKYIILLALFFTTLTLYGQNKYSIKGAITDTASGMKLQNTLICLLNQQDSTLESFTRADHNGSFSINTIDKGNYILLITYPGYADYVEKVRLDSLLHEHDFGTVNMISKAKLLNEVIIKGSRIAIKIKGDTTEYDAKAFKTQHNASIEDLLKQFPGIQVDQYGKITAQGQTVNKILVDGEEFFSDDPTLVTRNLRADMVDKIQLYDKKSDQATFTGIEDGQRTKTINVKLKEDKKNGYFGKIDAGGGNSKYYQGQAIFNRFWNKGKFSAYATTANNGKTDLGYDDNQKYASSGYNSFSGADGFSSSGTYNGKGMPVARTGGLHYDTKWNGDKEAINTNFKIGSLDVDGINNTVIQNNLPTGPINSNSNQIFHDHIFRKKLDGTYQVQLNSSSDLKVSFDGTNNQLQNNSNFTSTSTRGDGVLLNNNDRDLSNNGDEGIYNISAFYTKKFKKPFRTLSILMSESINRRNAKGYLKSKTNFYNDSGQLDSIQNINQYKTTHISGSALNTNIGYTEPLMKNMILALSYGISINNDASDRKSFGLSGADGYNTLIDSLSSNYKLNQLSNQVGAVFNLMKGKSMFSFGTKVATVNYNQINNYTGSSYKRNFINWAPESYYQYRFSQQESLIISYQGNTIQPSIDQIQPVIVNNDPLNVTLGNPNLKPTFSNKILVNYYSYKILSGLYAWMSGSYSLISNPIVSNLFTDSAGKSINQFINLRNKKQSSLSLNMNIGKKLKKPDMNVELDLSVNGNNSYNLSNNRLNLTNFYTYKAELNISKSQQKLYDANIRFGPNYTVSGSSLQPEINNNGRGFFGSAAFTVFLPNKFQFSSDGNYQYRARTQTFNTVFSRTLINASISRTFFKEDNLKLSIAGNDLLNQNIGFDRNTTGNFVTQNSYTTIRRYFMCSLIWSFNKFGIIAEKK